MHRNTISRSSQYSFTWVDASTGRRTWPAYCRFVAAHVELLGRLFFGGLRVIDASGGELTDAAANLNENPTVFGMFPHGTLPCLSAFLGHLPQFRAIFHRQESHVITLVASALFYVPWFRELSSWAGGRAVSRKSLRNALVVEKRSVALYPGGVEEQFYSNRVHPQHPFIPWSLAIASNGESRSPVPATVPTTQQREVVLCLRHKGFIREALRANAAIVPVLILNEVFTLRHLVELPHTLQTFFWRMFGVPALFVWGQRIRGWGWGWSPFPSPRTERDPVTDTLRTYPVVILLGRPLCPPGPMISGRNAGKEEVAVAHLLAEVEASEHPAAAGGGLDTIAAVTRAGRGVLHAHAHASSAVSTTRFSVSGSLEGISGSAPGPLSRVDSGSNLKPMNEPGTATDANVRDYDFGNEGEELEAMVDLYHRRLCEELQRLWDEYGAEFGCSEKHGVTLRMLYSSVRNL